MTRTVGQWHGRTVAAPTRALNLLHPQGGAYGIKPDGWHRLGGGNSATVECVRDGRVAGAIAIYPDGRLFCEVALAYRRQGIARQLFRELAAHLGRPIRLRRDETIAPEIVALLTELLHAGILEI